MSLIFSTPAVFWSSSPSSLSLALLSTSSTAYGRKMTARATSARTSTWLSRWTTSPARTPRRQPQKKKWWRASLTEVLSPPCPRTTTLSRTMGKKVKPELSPFDCMTRSYRPEVRLTCNQWRACGRGWGWVCGCAQARAVMFARDVLVVLT